ncbi:hypothetical protein NDU88_002278 [Pleurodeles waltl]|uniref:Uncharacterized protein n=1 Tax=Pleurodeles waltl TaxID=8319 RepID=A0AAV7SCS3_PLEWA|nr:hypothetical protein NDU88_002278 [Pleurodeles waltl]
MLLFLNGSAEKQPSLFFPIPKKEELATKERLATMASSSPERRSESSGSQTQRAMRYALNRYLRLPPASFLQLQLSRGFLRRSGTAAATFSSAGRRVLTLTLRRDASRVTCPRRLQSPVRRELTVSSLTGRHVPPSIEGYW